MSAVAQESAGGRVELETAREVCPTLTRRQAGEGALVVDVRERDEIARAAFDLPDVVVMPMSELESRHGELPRDRDLIMVCAVGERSLKATYFLMYHGHTRVANMEGGIAKWARKGFPIRGDAAFAQDTASAGCCGTAKPAGGGCCG